MPNRRDEMIDAARKFYVEWSADNDNDGETWGTAQVLADFALAQRRELLEGLRAKVESCPVPLITKADVLALLDGEVEK